MLEIRDILLRLEYADTPLNAEFVAGRLDQGAATLKRSTLDHAERIVSGLRASGLVEPLASEPGWFVLTDTGMSLRAASATKRIKRDRADRAIAKLLAAVNEINKDPIFLHDIVWVAVFGSYLTDHPDLGDIDVAIEMRGRWLDGSVTRDALQKAFVAKHPPPASLRNRWVDALMWPDKYTKRLLRADRAIKIIERCELEGLGCAYRQIHPETAEFPAKPDWSCERNEIILRSADGEGGDG